MIVRPCRALTFGIIRGIIRSSKFQLSITYSIEPKEPIGRVSVLLRGLNYVKI